MSDRMDHLVYPLIIKAVSYRCFYLLKVERQPIDFTALNSSYTLSYVLKSWRETTLDK